jgi:hypothetical protein
MVNNLGVPQNVGNFLSSWETGGFSRKTQLHGVSIYHKSKTITEALIHET